MKRYLGQTFTNGKGESLVYGEWHNFGGNVSLCRVSPNGYRIRLDTTGEVVTPAGPAGRDSIMMGLYCGRTPDGYAHYNFGDAYQPGEESDAV